MQLLKTYKPYNLYQFLPLEKQLLAKNLLYDILIMKLLQRNSFGR